MSALLQPVSLQKWACLRLKFPDIKWVWWFPAVIFETQAFANFPILIFFIENRHHVDNAIIQQNWRSSLFSWKADAQLENNTYF